MMIPLLRILWLLPFFALTAASVADELADRFANPPEHTKPRCYWYWIDGHISREGITHDLEAMRRIGIGEGYIGIIGGGDVKALTEPWWQLIEHAVREGGRIGVDIGLFNCPGWSQSGGPWIKPNQAMRYVALPELNVKGPQRFEGNLPAPQGDFQDIAVLAFPTPAGENDNATITTRTPTSISFQTPSAWTARSVTVHPLKPVRIAAELQASDDGISYRTVKKFPIDRHNPELSVGPVPLAPIVVSLPPTSAKFFRLIFSAACELGEVRLSSAARVENIAEKSLVKMFQDPQPPFDFYTWPAPVEPDRQELMVDPRAVRNISHKMTPDGVLRWDVPEGEWTVLRAVMVPTGTKNAPAPPEATGLEVDKMSRTALKSHFDAYVGKLLKRMPPDQRRSLKHVVADSYETGPENWTDDFAADFQRRYGYDPLPYLPVLTGRIVSGADQSDRFLWDVRRMVADRVAHDYVGGLRDLCHAHGLKMWLENYGHWGFPGEFLLYGGSCDEISGEFWADGDLGSIELRDAASAAHLYGIPVVWAEAFTGGPAFRNTPATLKARGDWAFCEGINQFVLHVYIHQPWDDRRPGVNAWFGTEFNRNNTWFDYTRPWIDYQRRCSVMLQAGKPVSDVAYFIGEDAPKMTGQRQPALPPGYDFDYINADAIENRLHVEDGRFVLPDGTSYRLLVLPPGDTMRPALLKKLEELAAAGGVVLGTPPQRSPSLQNYPACDAEVQKLAAALWGKKKIIEETTLQTTLDRLNAPPDVIAPPGILWKHRCDRDTDIYFLANQQSAPRMEIISFRVKNRAPELWWPETNHRQRAAVYQCENGRVQVPIHFGPTTSVFVVFREPADDGRIVQLSRNGQPLYDGTTADPEAAADPPIELSLNPQGRIEALVHRPGRYAWTTATGATGAVEVAAIPEPVQLDGPWEVTFDPKNGGPDHPVTFAALEDWTKRTEEGIRFYSGAAVYRKTFQLPAVSQPLQLDLGDVRSIARVKLGGREIATLWKPPYRIDIAASARPGKNLLEIEIVNTWLNRLLGDDLPGATKRVTSTTTRTWTGPPLPSGLLGPVTIRSAEKRILPGMKSSADKPTGTPQKDEKKP
ncbi:MAG: hypothetical protein JXB10_06550 [Pirellulales bacterium]|nr:hypothetical protein [Pirellulales bacterium]